MSRDHFRYTPPQYRGRTRTEIDVPAGRDELITTRLGLKPKFKYDYDVHAGEAVIEPEPGDDFAIEVGEARIDDDEPAVMPRRRRR